MDVQSRLQPPELRPSLQAASLLRIAEVSAVVGLCGSTIYALAAVGSFPRPIRLSYRCSRWRASEVLTWLEQLQ